MDGPKLSLYIHFVHYLLKLFKHFENTFSQFHFIMQKEISNPVIIKEEVIKLLKFFLD